MKGFIFFLAVLLMGAALIMLCAEVDEELSLSRWIVVFMLVKSAGFGVGWISYKLFKRLQED